MPYFKVLLVKQSYMALEGFYFTLQLILIFNLFSIQMLEVVDFSLQCRYLILSELESDPSVVFEVAEFFAS
jgi:hypothetical protein